MFGIEQDVQTANSKSYSFDRIESKETPTTKKNEMERKREENDILKKKYYDEIC